MSNQMLSAAAMGVKKKTADQHDDLVMTMTRYYEETMNDYIYAVPHIPPTLFELQHRHTEVRNTLLAECRTSMAGHETTEMIDATCDRLRHHIDKIYKAVVANNISEQKLCQAGFIIGWKKGVDTAHKRVSIPEQEDRF